MCTYLAKRGSVYYFRRAIPAGLRASFDGRAEFMISLRTKDRGEAKRRIPANLIEMERLLAGAMSGMVEDEANSGPVLVYAARPPNEKLAVKDRHVGHIVQAPSDSRSPVDSGRMLDTDVVDGWAAERKPVQKGVDTHRAVARWFYERVGRKPVFDITRADVLTFKAKLIEEGATAANIRVKLSRIRTLLQWAADNDLASDNVAKGISIKDAVQARNRRKEFDLESLRRIFGSPVFYAGERPAGGKGEAAYWLPLLALYTGARLEELGQLRFSDIGERAYVDDTGVEHRSWFITITSDDSAGLTLKNAASERVVPIHPTLIDRGFLAFVAASRQAKEPRLFPRLRPNVYGRLTAKWGEWFGSYLRKVCGVADRRMVFHSFRHTFKHYARHVGIHEGIQRQMMGHSSGDAADQYGSGYSLWQLVVGMNLYAVPGLSMPL